MNYAQLTDEELYALCVWREASGEGYTGMLGVAWNIWNRHLRWRQSLRSVILTPNQFTSMTVQKNPRDPEPNDPQMAMARTIRLAGNGRRGSGPHKRRLLLRESG